MTPISGINKTFKEHYKYIYIYMLVTDRQTDSDMINLCNIIKGEIEEFKLVLKRLLKRRAQLKQ